jgi:adenine-specific DNA-methyltransferase
MNKDFLEGKHTTIGFLTKHYSPYEGCERMFFTVENAKRMDYVRKCIENSSLEPSEKVFALASLLVSADAVANCASVYGAYLKKFKRVAEKPLVLKPIHTCSIGSHGNCFNKDVLHPEFLKSLEVDLLYLDPPYNERQYSKNYFPLSVLAMHPDEQNSLVLTGKTGIPGTCFKSPFCSKKTVSQSFETVLQHTKAKWVFISYNSESLLDKETLLTLLKNYGDAKVIERPYKRFQSQNQEKQEIKEYLFCLERQ